jgi:hypothetical protein
VVARRAASSAWGSTAESPVADPEQPPGILDPVRRVSQRGRVCRFPGWIRVSTASPSPGH